MLQELYIFQGVVAYTCNPNAQEDEAGGLWKAWGGPGLQGKTLSQKLIFIFYTSFFCLLKSQLSFRSDLLHGEFESEDTQVSYLQFATTWLSYFVVVVVVCQLDMS